MNVSVTLLLLFFHKLFLVKVCELLSWNLAYLGDKIGKTPVKKNKTGKIPVKTEWEKIN